MTHLPNGCKCSELNVFPANWQSPKASVRKPWYIHYRFYDPVNSPRGKLRIIKGMNEFANLTDRQEATQALIEVELNELKNLGFNPAIEKHIAPMTMHLGITGEMPYMDALHKALASAAYKGRTLSDIKSVLKYIGQAAAILHFEYLPIKDIKPSHLLLLLEQCGRIKTTWTNNTYNVYLKYLSILFGHVLQYRAIEYNPARDIRKKKITRHMRKVLTPKECERIDEFVKQFDERLWRFIHIFFHSGSRTTEILRVQREHVNLQEQKVKYLMLKGQQYEWVERTIKDIALPLWQAALKGCGLTQYVFSVGLKPGVKAIRAEQISRRWRTHVKKKLKIDCDFYSLKHLNTDQTSALLGLKAASTHNSHRSTTTTLHYAVNEKERQHQQLKKVNNHFAVG